MHACSKSCANFPSTTATASGPHHPGLTSASCRVTQQYRPSCPAASSTYSSHGGLSSSACPAAIVSSRASTGRMLDEQLPSDSV